MITIVRDTNNVKVRLDTDLPHENANATTRFNGILECETVAHAALLERYLTNRLAEALSKIRQDAYAHGWKDAKAKTRKCTWFSGRF